jgi:hypothetical protein
VSISQGLAPDFELLREDEGSGTLALRVPVPEAGRWFLNAFHEEEAFKG